MVQRAAFLAVRWMLINWHFYCWHISIKVTTPRQFRHNAVLYHTLWTVISSTTAPSGLSTTSSDVTTATDSGSRACIRMVRLYRLCDNVTVCEFPLIPGSGRLCGLADGWCAAINVSAHWISSKYSSQSTHRVSRDRSGPYSKFTINDKKSEFWITLMCLQSRLAAHPTPPCTKPTYCPLPNSYVGVKPT